MINILKEIQEKVPMRELLEYYGIYPKRSTNNYTCLFHSPDKHPSAGITKDGYRLRCYACGTYASIFDVVCQIEKCDFKKSMRIIDNNFQLGLFKKLTYKEKLELNQLQKEREIKKREKAEMETFENKIINAIVGKLRFWEKIENETTITLHEYINRKWENSDLHFYAIQQVSFLNWLISRIIGCKEDLEHECEFDYIYGNNKNELLTKLRNREILF